MRSAARAGGSEGNRRLTGATAAVLLVLLAAEGVTLLAIRPLVSAHVFIGMLLLPPVALKLASTGHRFVRYYTGHGAYRADGPPHPLLRLLGPVVVLATVGALRERRGSRRARPGGRRRAGPPQGELRRVVRRHGAHVLAHVLRVPRLASADWRRHEALPGAALRRWLLAGSLVAGLILAVATVHLAGPWHHFVGFDG